MRIFLIIIMVTQLGCAVFWETAAGTVIGNLGAELIKDQLDKEDGAKDEALKP